MSPTMRRSRSVQSEGSFKSGMTGMSSAVAKGVRSFRDDVSALLEPTRHMEERPIHTLSVVFNLLLTTMGVGILSLAATFQYAGIIGASALLLFGAVMAYLTMKLLVISMVMSGTQSFEELGEYCYGKAGRIVVQISLLVTTLVASVAFLVPLKHFLYDTIQNLLSAKAMQAFKDNSGSPNLCLAIVLGLVIMPLALMRKIDSLWFTSLVGIFFEVYFCLMCVGYFFQDLHSPLEDHVCHELRKDAANNTVGNITDTDVAYPTGDLIWIGSNFPDYCSTLTLVACSFCCQVSVFPIYRELRVADNIPKAVKKLDTASYVAMAIAGLTYIVAAGSGYYLYRELSDRASSILACYDAGNPLIIICYIGMSLVLMFAFPLMCFSIRYCVATIIFDSEYLKEGNMTLTTHVLLTLGITLPVAGVALLMDRLTVVLSVGGGLATPMFCYILPAVMYLKVLDMHEVDEKTGLMDRALSIDRMRDAEAMAGGCEEGAGENMEFIISMSNSSKKNIGYVILAIGIVWESISIYGSIYTIVKG